MAIITTHELDTKLARIELENAAYYLRRMSEDTYSMPKLSHIASNLADEIEDKLSQMQALINAEIAAENQD